MSRRIEGAREQVYVNVRFPPKLVDDIDGLVRQGRFASRSELVVTAVRLYLDEIKKRDG